MLSKVESSDRSIRVSHGKEYLILCLETPKSIDLVMILLGTNDLRVRFSVSAYDIANGAGVPVHIVQKSATYPGNAAPQVLLMVPPPVAVGRSSSALTGFADMFGGAEGRSQRFSEHYRRVALGRGCAFLDTSWRNHFHCI